MLIDVCARVRLPHPSAGPSIVLGNSDAQVIHAVASAVQAASFKSAIRKCALSSALFRRVEAALLKDDLLDPVDQLLDDPALVDLVRQCWAKRSPRSPRTGRRGMAPDRLLRCCVMKHMKGWSFRDLERELRSNRVYRRFTHFDAEVTPEFTVFSRSFALLSPAVTAEIHQQASARRPAGKVSNRLSE